MTIAVIGAKGVVGRSLVEFYRGMGHSLIEVDRDTEAVLEEASQAADAVMIATLPIEEVAALIERASKNLRSGGLIVHGTSIENPLAPNSIDTNAVAERGQDLCHLHFHFRPEVPLRRTVFGQHVTVCWAGDGAKWKPVIEAPLEVAGAFIHTLKPGEHDTITSISQLAHMTVAALIANLWSKAETETLKTGVQIGGPPCRSLVRSVLRTGTTARVAASILTNHPQAEPVMADLQGALAELAGYAKARNSEVIALQIETARALFAPEELGTWDAETAQLARLEADIRKAHYRFVFSPEQNRVGLLGRVLAEFDARGVDKTSTIAQVNPDGGCTILIGVRETSDNAEAAATAIEGWE